MFTLMEKEGAGARAGAGEGWRVEGECGRVAVVFEKNERERVLCV
jgi:hypothetical protein